MDTFRTAPHNEIVVLVTERRKRILTVPDMSSRDLDMTTPKQADAIRQTLMQVVKEVVEVNDLKNLSDRLKAFDDPLVLPHWNGSISRNRTGLVTSICEAQGIRYIGADTYARLVTNDKSLSKLFLMQSGVKTPPSVFIASEVDFDLINALPMPCIVKPNMEGSSIGINKNSIAADRSSAKRLCRSLLQSFPQGIIAEQYLVGAEVSFSALCRQGKVDYWAAAERFVQDDPDYLKTHIYDHELKSSARRQVDLRPFDAIDHDVLEAVGRLVRMLGHIDFVRLDGRISDGSFHAIEITVDPLLAPRSEFLGGLALSGKSSEQVFYDIIDISRRAWKCRRPNS